MERVILFRKTTEQSGCNSEISMEIETTTVE